MSSGLSKQEPRASQTIVNVPLAESFFPIAHVAVMSTVAPQGHCLSFGRTAFHVFALPLGMATVTGFAEQLVVTTTLSHVVDRSRDEQRGRRGATETGDSRDRDGHGGPPWRRKPAAAGNLAAGRRHAATVHARGRPDSAV